MLITATQKYSRQTPRKVRLVANAIKSKPLPEALKQLSVMEKRASLIVMKVLRQAIANAVNNHGVAFTELKLKSIQIMGGPSYKRFQPVSRGRAHNILKRTSHIKVELETTQPDAAAPQVAAVEAKPKTKASKVTKGTKKK